MMKNSTIRLTEEDLKNIITEAVNKIITESELEEGFWDSAKGMAKKVGGDIKSAVPKMANKAKQGFNNVANKAMNGINNVTNNAKQNVNKGIENAKNYYNDVKQAGVNASNNAEIEKSIKIINNLVSKNLVNPKAANMVIASMRKYIK